MTSSSGFGRSSPTCSDSGGAIRGGESTGTEVQAPVWSWHVAQTLRASGPFALRRLIKDSRVPLGFETQMRMCSEIFKPGKREFKPNQGLRDVGGGGAESVTQRGQFILLGRMLAPWDRGPFAQHPTMSGSSFVTSHEQHRPRGGAPSGVP